MLCFKVTDNTKSRDMFKVYVNTKCSYLFKSLMSSIKSYIKLNFIIIEILVYINMYMCEAYKLEKQLERG